MLIPAFSVMAAENVFPGAGPFAEKAPL